MTIAPSVRRLALISLNLLLACQGSSPAPDREGSPLRPMNVPLQNLALRKGSDCTAIRDQLVNAFIEELVDQSAGYGYRGDMAVAENAVADTGAHASGGNEPDGVSTTNVQEAGVDEADIVKTAPDGTMYILRANQLSTVDAFPADGLHVTQVQELVVADPNTYNWAHGLYLEPDSQQIVALQSVWNLEPQTLWTSLSASDPTQPEVTAQLRLDGELLSSRRVGNRVHLVLGHGSSLYQSLTESQWTEFYARIDELAPISTTDRHELRSWLRTELGSITADQLLPAYTDPAGQSHPLVACQDIYHADVSVRPAMMSLISLDLDGSNVQSTALLNHGWLTYASPERLYVVQNGSDWWWQGANSTQSVVYGFAIGEQAPQYTGYGVMEGYIYSSFALSDYAGYLRVAHTLPAEFLTDGSEGDDVPVSSSDDVASTDTAAQPPAADATPLGSNRLTVFALPTSAASAASYPVAGTIPSFAAGEQIYAVRYLGDRAYVVTFRTIDPLFAIDLRDPRSPRITGELEIPGFSTYIHPLDATTLLTLGYGGTSDGTITELELKLFDVADAAAPRQLQTFALAAPGSYAYSEASYDHRAFTYYAPRNLFVLPVVSWSETQPFAGLVAVNASRAGAITLAGRINQKDLAWLRICAPDAETEMDAQYMCQYGDYIWAAAPRRSVVMTLGAETYLYSVSDLGIKAVNVATPDTTLGSLPLPPYDGAWWYYGYEAR